MDSGRRIKVNGTVHKGVATRNFPWTRDRGGRNQTIDLLLATPGPLQLQARPGMVKSFQVRRCRSEYPESHESCMAHSLPLEGGSIGFLFEIDLIAPCPCRNFEGLARKARAFCFYNVMGRHIGVLRGRFTPTGGIIKPLTYRRQGRSLKIEFQGLFPKASR